MVARKPSELPTIICAHCKQEVIRMRIGQTYCRRPECQKAQATAECAAERAVTGQCKRKHTKKVVE